MTQIDRVPAKPVPAGARPGAAALAPHAVAVLRRAFAVELAQRLPRLATAARTRTPELLQLALRDAHSLGSGSDVVGEPDAASTARALEALLRGWADGSATDLNGLDRLVEDLLGRLGAWRP